MFTVSKADCHSSYFFKDDFGSTLALFTDEQKIQKKCSLLAITRLFRFKFISLLYHESFILPIPNTAEINSGIAQKESVKFKNTFFWSSSQLQAEYEIYNSPINTKLRKVENFFTSHVLFVQASLLSS